MIKDLNITEKSVSGSIMKSWEEIISIISEITGFTTTLITRGHPPIQIIKTGLADNNPPGREEVIALADYCYVRILSERGTAGEIAKKDNINLFGYPITHPTGEVFGVVCLILNEGSLKKIYQRLVIEFSKIMGGQLEHLGIEQQLRLHEEIELRLKQTEARLKDYVNNAPVGIFVADCQGRFIEVNDKAAEISGCRKSELLGKTIFDFYEEENSSELIRFFKDQDRLSEVHQIIKKDGSLHYVKVNAVKLPEDKFIGFVEDIDKRVQAEKELERQKGYFQQLFDRSPDGIAILNNEGEIIRINQSFKDIFKVNKRDVRGKDINDVIVPEHKIQEGRELTRRVQNGEMYIGESVRQTGTGQKVHVLIYGYPITLKEDQLGIYAVYKNITERKKEEEKVKYLSFHDQMTGLYNRRYFEAEMTRMNRSRELPVSIIVADIDDLKKTNDRFGHKEGDNYIKMAAGIIEKSTRDADIVARIGGDEFAVVLPATGRRTAQDIKKRILKECNEVSQRLENPISISVGVAVKEDEETGLDEVFIEADNNMYESKNRTEEAKV